MLTLHRATSLKIKTMNKEQKIIEISPGLIISGKIFKLAFIFSVFSLSSFAQEITEENYLRLDSTIWMQYEQDMAKISAYRHKYPEKKDSLIDVTSRTLEVALQKNKELAIRYASVPSGLKRLFMVRLQISKDTLQAILINLPDTMRNSPYGKSILYHIESKQVEEGSQYYDFKATTSDGKEFALSSLEGKNILLLYGGLDCMGKDGRDYLNTLYNETSRDDFEIVVYCPASNMEELKELLTYFPCDFLLVSDFLQDHTPMKILYGAQATPTCFFINEQGIVEMKTVGLEEERVKQLLKSQ
jgi:peroxiredoxin